MNAVERVIEYADIKTEDFGGNKPPAAWPTEGRLEVNDLVVGYAADLPPVLKGISFSVRPNERIGVVGRTGAGKSSLTLALFRFLEARSGSIYVDGLDVAKIPLPDLRSRLAIIPQARHIPSHPCSAFSCLTFRELGPCSLLRHGPFESQPVRRPYRS
jgi:ABC-type multidrug transport system fused ATPase/permease subunit